MRANVRACLTVPCLALLALSGCQTISPAALGEGRIHYNEAVQQTSITQALLNIVRVYKNEPPLSVNVVEIIPGMSSSGSLGGSVTGLGIGKKSGMFRAGSLLYGTVSPSVSVTESYSAIIQPVIGTDFIEEFVKPIPLEYVSRMLDSTWPTPTVLEFGINGITRNINEYGAALNAISKLSYDSAIDIFAIKSSSVSSVRPKISGSVKISNVTNSNQSDPIDKIVLSLKAMSIMDCETNISILVLWSRLLTIYNRAPRALAKDMARISNLKPENNVDCNDIRRLAVEMQKYNRIELASGERVDQGSTRDGGGREVTTWSAYGLLRSVNVSNWTPSEIIDVVSPEFYQKLRAEPWNEGRDFYTFLFDDLCADDPDGTVHLRCHFLLMRDDEKHKKMRDDEKHKKNRDVDDLLTGIGDRKAQKCAPPEDNAHPGPARPILVANFCEYDSALEDILNQRRRFILVQHSSSEPSDAYVSIHRDGEYFFVGKDDRISQQNLALLHLIIAIQSVAPKPNTNTSIAVGGSGSGQ